jgi:pSer/pThr/pTyr-binding forkhead associated (FHA) protein
MYEDEPTMMGQGRPAATLVIRQGPQAGMSFPLTANQVVIGREESIGISLQDPEASRRHARLSWQGGHYVIEDMGSTNGTFVNGVQITSPQILSPGDSIGIGQTALVFQVAGAPVGTPPYQAPPQYTPAYTAPAAENTAANKLPQYALYGCGCLLLLSICCLLSIAAWALLDPASFGDLTGFEIISSIEGLRSVLYYI